MTISLAVKATKPATGNPVQFVSVPDEGVPRAPPDTRFPLAVPVKAPTNVVEVIEVAPVITPASSVTVPSKVIACPTVGVIASVEAPADEIVFPFIVMSSTVKVVRVPRDVIAACAAPVTVAAEPVTFPTNAFVVSISVNHPFVTLAPVAAIEPVIVILPVPKAIDEGVISPRVKVIAGVNVEAATVPETPFAVTTETESTVPPATFAQTGFAPLPCVCKISPVVPAAKLTQPDPL